MEALTGGESNSCWTPAKREFGHNNELVWCGGHLWRCWKLAWPDKGTPGTAKTSWAVGNSPGCRECTGVRQALLETAAGICRGFDLLVDVGRTCKEVTNR